MSLEPMMEVKVEIVTTLTTVQTTPRMRPMRERGAVSAKPMVVSMLMLHSAPRSTVASSGLTRHSQKQMTQPTMSVIVSATVAMLHTSGDSSALITPGGATSVRDASEKPSER